MKTLYIIGNGFDLHHRLNTQYSSFATFLLQHYRDLYRKMVQYYDLPDFDDPSLTPKEIEDLKTEWNVFEEKLAGLDFESILDEHSDYIPSVSDDDWNSDVHAYEQIMERIVNDLTYNLFAAFREFILHLTFPAEITDSAITMDTHAAVLNFNYTDTLERYYDFVENNLLYIHGKAIRDEVVVLGHSKKENPMQEAPNEMPEGLTAEEKEYWMEEQSGSYDYSYESGKNELRTYFEKSFKPTAEIIKEHNQFFQSLRDVNHVIVLGHSLAAVDLPYFSEVKDSIQPDAKWTVSWYKDDERIYKRKLLEDMGINPSSINLIQMGDLRN